MSAPTVIFSAAPLRAADIDARSTFLRSVSVGAVLAVPSTSLPIGAIRTLTSGLDRRAHLIILCAAITTLLGLLDLLLTLAVARVCGHEFEVNPLGRYFLSLGPLYLGAFKGISIAGNIAITWAVRSRPSALFCACASALIMLALAAHWCAALYQIHQGGLLLAVLNP